MRYQGRITTWKDDKGFGFITPNGSDAQVFVHITAFPDRHRPPVLNELVTYRLGTDPRGRARAEKVAFVGDGRTVPQGSGAAPRSTAAGRPIRSLVALPQVAPIGQFSCDGRKHCSQMKSCAEATYFLKNCPGVMMDGDNDGIPCEEQWCKRTR